MAAEGREGFTEEVTFEAESQKRTYELPGQTRKEEMLGEGLVCQGLWGKKCFRFTKPRALGGTETEQQNRIDSAKRPRQAGPVSLELILGRVGSQGRPLAGMLAFLRKSHLSRERFVLAHRSGLSNPRLVGHIAWGWDETAHSDCYIANQKTMRGTSWGPIYNPLGEYT